MTYLYLYWFVAAITPSADPGAMIAASYMDFDLYGTVQPLVFYNCYTCIDSHFGSFVY